MFGAMYQDTVGSAGRVTAVTYVENSIIVDIGRIDYIGVLLPKDEGEVLIRFSFVKNSPLIAPDDKFKLSDGTIVD